MKMDMAGLDEYNKNSGQWILGKVERDFWKNKLMESNTIPCRLQYGRIPIDPQSEISGTVSCTHGIQITERFLPFDRSLRVPPRYFACRCPFIAKRPGSVVLTWRNKISLKLLPYC